MQDFVGHQILDVALAELRHLKHAIVDHHECAAFISVPREITLGDGEVLVRIGAEPARIGWNRLGGNADGFPRIPFVLRQCETLDGDAFHFADVLLVTRAAQEREIAQRARIGLPLDPSISRILESTNGT